MERWISLLGLVVFVGVAWALSSHRRLFPWRIVFWGLTLQAVIAVLILRTTPGRKLFDGFQAVITRFTSFAESGNQLVFGALANPEALERGFGAGNTVLLVVTLTGLIIFVSAVSSVLYHYGILQYVVRGVAWVMRRAMRTSGSETLGAAANIFMGQTEAPLVIKPYLERMTRSELFCLMTSGFATIAGSVFAVYTGVFQIPAGDLLTASVMSAPAALMIAKIMQPETEPSETAAGAKAVAERTSVNGLDAVVIGATDGMRLAINVAAMLIAFTAVVALLNFLLSLCAQPLGWQTTRPLQEILGYANAPCAWLMGVPAQDSFAIGQILGERIVLNEFMGYLSLAEARPRLDPRSSQLAAYALCGFANFASVAIQIGGISTLAPTRRSDLASLGLRAMVGGLLACYLTACVVGVLT